MWFVGLLLAIILTIIAMRLMYSGRKRIRNLFSERPCCAWFTRPLPGTGIITALCYFGSGVSLMASLFAGVFRWLSPHAKFGPLDLTLVCVTIALVCLSAILRARADRQMGEALADPDFILFHGCRLPPGSTDPPGAPQ